MAFVKLGSSLQNLLVKILGEDDKDYITLSLNWDNLVGKYLAENSYVYNIDNGVLYIGVANGVIMQELSLNRDSLKEIIRKQYKIRIKNIVFFIKDDVKKN
jgi:hypothetical protein